MKFLITGGTLNPLKPDYLRALEQYGHSGFIIYPSALSLNLSEFDALLLPGGADIAPARFSAELLPNGSETLDLLRDALEFPIFDYFLKHRKPIIGICRGAQVINVALGGNIWQDLPYQCGLSHSAPENEAPMSHPVIWSDGTPHNVNSYHHQSIRLLGQGLKAAARSSDGIIEAIEGIDLPIRAVQWHPEKPDTLGMEYLMGVLNLTTL